MLRKAGRPRGEPRTAITLSLRSEFVENLRKGMSGNISKSIEDAWRYFNRWKRHTSELLAMRTPTMFAVTENGDLFPVWKMLRCPWCKRKVFTMGKEAGLDDEELAILKPEASSNEGKQLLADLLAKADERARKPKRPKGKPKRPR